MKSMSFQDGRYGIEFIVTYGREITEQQAQFIAEHVIQQRKDALFQVWNLNPENKDWVGDHGLKKDELFTADSLPSSVEILPAYVDSCFPTLPSPPPCRQANTNRP